MRLACTALALSSVVSLCPCSAGAQTVLTLADVLAKARDQAPQIVSARLAVAEARARVTGASLRFQSNPEFDVVFGGREGANPRSTDFQIGAAQMFEPGVRRVARVAGATAQVEAGVATVEETTRDVLREAAATFYRAVYAGERVRLVSASVDLADEILQAADRRFRAGDLAVLDVNLARAALARARAERQAVEADQAATLGWLQAQLRVEGPIAVQGSLAVTDGLDVAALTRSLDERPELRELAAAIRAADADVDLARTLTRANYGVGLRFQRESGDNIVLGGFTVSLPTFSKGQELNATGTARGARLRFELEAARTRMRIELQTALAAHQYRVAAVRLLEAEALPGLGENDVLATRSFDVGQIGLPDVLLIRRELLETRSQYLTALLEAALARVVVDATAGVLR